MYLFVNFNIFDYFKFGFSLNLNFYELDTANVRIYKFIRCIYL